MSWIPLPPSALAPSIACVAVPDLSRANFLLASLTPSSSKLPAPPFAPHLCPFRPLRYELSAVSRASPDFLHCLTRNLG